MKNKRILYIQYTNPAAYPPLEHSSRMLADRGWKVLFLGLGSHAVDALRFPDHANISVKKLAYYPGGWRQQLQYLLFCVWTIVHVARWKPDWIYASDPFSCLPALLSKCIFNVRIVYHEHDSPMPDNGRDSAFLKMIWRVRKLVVKKADICVLPNENRKKLFISNTGRADKVFCVWNCPRADEVKDILKTRDKVILYYHGNANPEYIPLALLEAMKLLPDELCLRIIAFEVIGHKGYLKEFQDTVDKMGLGKRLEMRSPEPRCVLLGLAATCHIGLAFTSKKTNEVNNVYRVGASNKPFDYMACGMALLVSDIKEWNEMYVDAGYGLSCDPQDPKSIARSIQYFLDHPQEMKKMGELGRKKILEKWNYQTQFQPVLDLLEGRNFQ